MLPALGSFVRLYFVVASQDLITAIKSFWLASSTLLLVTAQNVR
jgi:hypothetical protein